jgi:dimethylaniline monooxygenase (N-oxide forming) / hypotaurine monooxygenase
MEKSKHVPDLDVIIIGAGWSGLLTCKYCLAEGLKTLVLESRDHIGGVWAYTTDQSFGGVMKNTEMTSSRCITEISDFPMPVTYPDFPSHEEILAYLKSYCAHFHLEEHIRFGCNVIKVKKNGAGWQITCVDGSMYLAKSLIVSSGVHRYPNEVSGDLRFHHYTGRILHSVAIKEISADYAGKTIIIWGGGESASDIALEASSVTNRVYWCIPNGQWFAPKVVNGWPPFPSGRRKVVDHISSRLRLLLSPTRRYSPFISQYFEYTFGVNGHGQKAWKTEAPYNRCFLNKSSSVLSRVDSGHVIPKRDIERCEGDTVFFTDGSFTKAEVIITCSGYRPAFPFFEGPAIPACDPRTWYKYIFYNDDPTLAFVGFARPVFGSIPGISELQARYASLVLAGKRSLPPRDRRVRVIGKDAAFWNHHFRHTSLRITGLVDHFLYSDQLAKLIGCRPCFRKLFFSSLGKWWKAISSPWNSCQFWLNNKSQHERIFRTLDSYRDNQNSEVYIFLWLAPVLPLIGLYSYVRIFLKEHFMRPRPVKLCQGDTYASDAGLAAKLDR